MAKSQTLPIGSHLILSVVLAALNGCSAMSTYAVSRPISNSPQVNISNKGRLKLEDTVIFVSPTNYVLINSGIEWFPMIPDTQDIPPKDQDYSSGYYEGFGHKKPGFFILEVFFAVGKKPVVFYPGSVVLRYHGNEWRAINTYELVKMVDATNPFWGHYPYNRLCAGKEQDSHERHYYHNPIMVTHYDGTANKLPGIGVPERIKIEVGAKRCFALEFPVNPPDPREQFNVEFRSLRIDDRDVPIQIKYVPDTVKHRHG